MIVFIFVFGLFDFLVKNLVMVIKNEVSFFFLVCLFFVFGLNGIEDLLWEVFWFDFFF